MVGERGEEEGDEEADESAEGVIEGLFCFALFVPHACFGGNSCDGANTPFLAHPSTHNPETRVSFCTLF